MQIGAALGHNLGPPLDDERWDAKPRLGQSYACPKVRISALPDGLVPEKYFTAIELSPKPDVEACCRTIRKQGSIEAWYSSPADRARRVPDIYVLTCNECGRLHRRFCVGGSIGSGAYPEYRPFWPGAETVFAR